MNRDPLTAGPPASCRAGGRSGPSYITADTYGLTVSCPACGSLDLAWPAESTPAGADGRPLTPGDPVECRLPGYSWQPRRWARLGYFLGVHLAENLATGNPDWLTSARVHQLDTGALLAYPTAGLRTADGCSPEPHTHGEPA